MRYKYRRRLDRLSTRPVNLLGIIPPPTDPDYVSPSVGGGGGVLAFQASGEGHYLAGPSEPGSGVGLGVLVLRASGQGVWEASPNTAQGEITLQVAGEGHYTSTPPVGVGRLVFTCAGVGVVGSHAPEAPMPEFRLSMIAAGQQHSVMVDSGTLSAAAPESQKNVVTESGNVSLSSGRNVILPSNG